MFSPLLGGQTFLSEEHLQELANAYSIIENYLKHETPFATNSEGVIAAYVARTISLIYSFLRCCF